MKTKNKYRAYIKETDTIKEVESIYFPLGSKSGKDIVIDGEWYSFQEVELIQYTGINDKNNKEIYEGDIICETCDGVDDIGLVYFSEGMFKVNFKSAEDYALAGCDMEETEVTGNVFLEQEKYEELYKFMIL